MNTILYILTMFLAFLGIIYEYLLAHFISGILGGAYAILFATFCLFAAALGLGSLSYSLLQKYNIHNLKFLSLLQFIISISLVGLPSAFEKLNLIYLSSVLSYYSVLSLSSLPVIALGLITGFELPLMFKITRAKISQLLFWDYLGMFIGVLVFPLIFFLELQIHDLCYFLSAITFALSLICLILYKMSAHRTTHLCESAKSQLEKTQPEESQSATFVNEERAHVFKNQQFIFILGLLFVFLMSFCSFAYQGLLGKVVTSILGDHYAVRSYAIGFFILGMSLGAMWTERMTLNSDEALKKLIKVETYLCCLAALSPIILYGIAGLVSLLVVGALISIQQQEFIWWGAIGFSMVSLLVGLLTGMEMPLVFQWLKMSSDDKRSYYLISANYVAAIFSGALIGFVLPLFVGFSFSFLIIISLNIVFMLLVYLCFSHFKSQVLWSLSVVLVFCVINAFGVYPARQFYLNAHYSAVGLSSWTWESFQNSLRAMKAYGMTYRIESFYQNIDLVNTEDNKIEARDKNFYLYLNQQPQFNTGSIEGYHGSMIAAARAFQEHNHVKKILILGAGDGLLAKYLLQTFNQADIKLVELDPVMVQMANENTKFLQLNAGSLRHSKIQTLIGDGYKFVRETSEKFDLIFVDFPYPTSVDLGRLYSVEFYEGVRKALSPTGVMIMDAPMLVRFHHLKRIGLDPIVNKILSTLHYAGFTQPFILGAFDPFVAVAKDNRLLKIHPQVLESVSNVVFSNLHSMEHDFYDVQISEDLVNTVLQPTIMGME